MKRYKIITLIFEFFKRISFEIKIEKIPVKINYDANVWIHILHRSFLAFLQLYL